MHERRGPGVVPCAQSLSLPVLYTPASIGDTAYSYTLQGCIVVLGLAKQDFSHSLGATLGSTRQLPEPMQSTVPSSPPSLVVLCDSRVSMLILAQGLCISCHCWLYLSYLSSCNELAWTCFLCSDLDSHITIAFPSTASLSRACYRYHLRCVGLMSISVL